MTVHDWIASRAEAAPAELRQAVLAALAAHARADVTETAHACLAAAAHGLEALLAGQRFDRGGALDLLVVDALTTYAFEYASEAGLDVGAAATDGLRRFAAIADAHG